MKKVILLILTLLLVSAVMIFANAAKEDEPVGKIELRISWWGNQTRHDRTLKVIEMFEAENSDIDIIAEPMGWGAYWEKMATQAAGKNLPDVFQQSYAYLPDYAKKGLLEDLDPYVQSGALDLSNVDDSFLGSAKSEGKLYGVTLGVSTEAVIYDPEIFNQAGAVLPEFNWTWEDYKVAAMKISKLGKYINIWILPDQFIANLRETGRNLLKDDYSALSNYDDSIFINIFNQQLELMEAGALPPAKLFSEIDALPLEERLIVKGKEAMHWGGANQVIAYSKAAGKPLKLAMIPRIGIGKSGAGFAGMSFCVAENSNSDHKAAAVKFIDYFINNVEANKVLMAERGVPVSSEIRDALYPNLNDAQVEMFKFIDAVPEYYSPLPFQAGVSEVSQKLFKQIREEIILGQISPEEGATKYRKLSNEALARRN